LDCSGGVGTREGEGEKTGGDGQLKEGHRGRTGVEGGQEGREGKQKRMRNLAHGYL